MKKTVLLLLALSAIASVAVSQSYNNPESIVYDAAGKRYFISNKAGNTIVQLDSLGKLTDFVSKGLYEPKGLLIVGDTLVSVNSNSIQAFLLSDTSRVKNIAVAGSVFMNDVATDKKGNLYVSDMDTRKIYKISLKTDEYSTIASIPTDPNGLLYDARNNSLLICTWGSKAKIFSLQLDSLKLKTAITTTLTDLDGLARDNCGNIYVSSWGSNAVYAFDSVFQHPPTIVSKGHSGPADISIIEDSQVLAIPNFNSNKINLIRLNKGCGTINYLKPQKNSYNNIVDSLLIDWEDVTGVTSYELEYSKDSLFRNSVLRVQTDTSHATIKELSGDSKYFWRVRPDDGNVKSLFREVWTFTTTKVTSTGLNHISICTVYPNPATDKISLEMESSELLSCYYSITDFNGKIVKTGCLDTPIINVSELSEGLYLLTIFSEKKVDSEKITIRR